jgi:hypothetical protein
MGTLVKPNIEFDRIVALSPVTNAVLQNCIDLAQSQGNLHEIEVLKNVGTQSLKRSLERMDVQIFVDDPLLFVNDLYKTDLLRKDFNEDLFCRDMKWIADRLMSKQALASQIPMTTWVFDYPERHLSNYVGIDLPLDRQQRSRQISEVIEFLALKKAISDDLIDNAISVLLVYGLDDGWKPIDENLLHQIETEFALFYQYFPLHDEFRKRALRINQQKFSKVEIAAETDVLVNGTLDMIRVLSNTSHSNTQQFASYYKNMLDLTLETSTRLLDAAASSRAAEHFFAKELAELPRLNAHVSKLTEELEVKNRLLEALIAAKP